MLSLTCSCQEEGKFEKIVLPPKLIRRNWYLFTRVGTFDFNTRELENEILWTTQEVDEPVAVVASSLFPG